MKVLHINCNYIGTTLHQKMVERLDALGVENQVFVPTYNKELAVIEVNDNVLVQECFRKWDRVSFYYKQSKILKSVENTINIQEYDVVHAYTLFTDGNVALSLKKKYGIPYVVAIRNTDINDFFKYRPYLRGRGMKIMQEAEKVFFLSPAYKNTMFEKYVPEYLKETLLKKSIVMPNGIDDFWFENKPDRTYLSDIDMSNLRVVFAGQVSHLKNVETTLKALDILRKKGINVSYTVVGKVVHKDVFAKVQQDKYTTYIEPQPKEKLIEIYRNHDIFVMPSVTETFGLVYAEAISQGIPVVYTRGQGFDGQFEEGVVGYAVEALDAGSVAAGIEHVVKHYAQLRDNCVKAAGKFKWSVICQEYVNIYQEIQMKGSVEQ